MRAALALASLVAIIASAGCAIPRTGPVKLAPPSSELSWSAVVQEHTRRDQAWAFPVRQADLRATLATPRLRAAFAGQRDQFHGEPSADFEENLARIEAAEGREAEIVVFVCLYITDLVNRNIAAGYTEWDTTLSSGGAKVRPLNFKQERYTPALKALLPHADRFDDIWVLRFPAKDAEGNALMRGAEPLTLSIASARATVSVEWSLPGTR